MPRGMQALGLKPLFCRKKTTRLGFTVASDLSPMARRVEGIKADDPNAAPTLQAVASLNTALLVIMCLISFYCPWRSAKSTKVLSIVVCSIRLTFSFESFGNSSSQRFSIDQMVSVHSAVFTARRSVAIKVLVVPHRSLAQFVVFSSAFLRRYATWTHRRSASVTGN